MEPIVCYLGRGLRREAPPSPGSGQGQLAGCAWSTVVGDCSLCSVHFSLAFFVPFQKGLSTPLGLGCLTPRDSSPGPYVAQLCCPFADTAVLFLRVSAQTLCPDPCPLVITACLFAVLSLGFSPPLVPLYVSTSLSLSQGLFEHFLPNVLRFLVSLALSPNIRLLHP